MAAGAMPSRIAPEEYLERERKATFKSEYWLDFVYAMSGVTETHDLICVNLLANLHRRLAGRPCRLHTSDTKVGVTKKRGFAYPDLTLTCGERKFYDAVKDVLTNPTVIFEVLSDSTRAFYQGGKWDEYQKLESLRHYVLVEQKARTVRHYARTSEGDWRFQTITAPDAVLRLAAVEIELPLAEIYWEIQFPPAEPDVEDTDGTPKL